MIEPSAADAAVREAKALADPSRAAIHRYVLRAVTPATIAELVGVTGLHHTAVRQHLTKLEAAGLVTREVLAPNGRGRPRLAYRGIEHPGERPYRELAGMLADAVRTGRTARDVGRDTGARSATPGGDPVEAVVAHAQRLGFDPVVVGAGGHGDASGDVTEIELRACPYAELAMTDTATVCSLHLGLAEGVATAVGGLVVEDLAVALTEAGRCRFRVRRSPT